MFEINIIFLIEAPIFIKNIFLSNNNKKVFHVANFWDIKIIMINQTKKDGYSLNFIVGIE